jgi:uncharacterized protein (TIRG00374 family)
VLKRTSLMVVGLVLTAGLIVLGAYVADWRQVAEALAGVDPYFLVASIPPLVGTLVAFGWRWGQLIAVKPPRFRDLFSLMMIGYLANAILPARSGDIIRAVLLRQTHGISFSLGLASLALERILDLSALCALGLILSWVVPLPALILSAIYACVAGTVAVVLLLVVASRHGDRLHALAASHPRFFAHSYGRLSLDWLRRFVLGIEVMRSIPRLAAAIALTALGWSCLAVFMMSMIWAFHLPVPWSAGLLVLITTNLGALIPLTPGAVGVYHFMAVLALALWKINQSSAIAFAIVSHAIAIGTHIVLGLVCAWYQGVTFANVSRMSDSRDVTISG